MYSLVNVIGLSTGILFVFLIGVYVWNELSVNKQLRNARNQYFLESRWTNPNMGNNITTLGPLAKQLKEAYPSLVKNYYRWDGITSVVSKGEKHLRENIQLGDSTLLSMYGFGLLHGDAHTALTLPYSAVITQEVALKYFGRTDVVGETLSIQSFSGSDHPFSITGVLNRIPENSVIQLNDANHNGVFIPTNTFAYFGRNDFESWTNIYIPSYIELADGVTPDALAGPVRKLIGANAPAAIAQNLRVVPLPLRSYYLLKNNALVKRMLWALSFVGFFIMLMAVINFVNISISSSSARIREIGLRKVMGGMRKQIIFQFLIESVILVLIATVIALAAYPFAKPLFGGMLGKELPSLLSLPVVVAAILLLFVVVAGVLAGFYPAWILSALQPVDSIKGKLKTVEEKVWLRKGLVTLQFSIAGVVLIAAVIVSQQVAFFFSQGLGYNKEFVVSSQVPRDWTPAGVRKMETVRSGFSRLPQVSAVSLSYEIPNGMNSGVPSVYRFGGDSTTAVVMQSLITDAHYLDVYQIPLKAGSFFEDGDVDSSRVVLNEKAAVALGWKNPADAVGQLLRIAGSPLTYTVAGVSGDFHFDSMQRPIQPDIFFQSRLANTYRFLSFKIKAGNAMTAVRSIEKKWAELLPGSSFEYSFMDESLRTLYKNEIQLQKAAYTATALSVIVALLGILGLISLGIKKRAKEIGIRKVLGSSVAGIILLFLKEFLWVILVASLVACPLAYLTMQRWLQEYAYRVPITVRPFLLTIGLLAFCTTMLICLQTIRAALTNPVTSLRSE